MRELFLARAAKGSNMHPKGAREVEHVADRAIFPGRVDPLQHDQECPLSFGIKDVLQPVDLRRVFCSPLLCFGLSLEMELPPRIQIGEVDLLAGRHHQIICEWHAKFLVLMFVAAGVAIHRWISGTSKALGLGAASITCRGKFGVEV